MASTDDPRPNDFILEQLAEDLTLSNEEGMSWFGYDYDPATNELLIDMYGDDGGVIRKFRAAFTIKEEEL
jgi:hypothetical protein